MKKFINVFLALYSLIAFTSCGSGFYTPVHDVMHSTSEKGEMVASVSFNRSRNSSIQSSLSYSPVSNIGLAYSNIAGTALQSNSFGIGAYTNRLFRKSNMIQFCDVYGGFAFGNSYNEFYARNYNPDYYYNIDAKYHKYFIQGGWHVEINRFRFDLISKYTLLDWKSIIINGAYKYPQQSEALNSKDPFTLIELNPKLSMGPSQYKINFGCNVLLKGSNNPSFDWLVVYGGFSVNVNKLLETYKQHSSHREKMR